MVDERFSLNNDPVGFIFRVPVIRDRYSLFKILLKLLFSHGAELLSVVDGVFDFSDLFEDCFFASLKCVLLARKGLANAIHFI